MEKVLQKLARQLNAYDEASLMALWEKYAAQVQRFEPTKRWEEAVIVLGFIQTVRWKNQLFNYNWSENSRPRGGTPPLEMPGVEDLAEFSGERPADRDGAKQRAKVLRFRPREGDEPV